MSEQKEFSFLKKIVQAVKKSGGEDSNLRHALEFHLSVLLYSNTADQIETKMELCQYLLSKMFLDKMDLFPIQPIKCQIDEYSDWPLLPLPTELFGSEKQEDTEKTKWFHKSLKHGDVLDCRVAEALPTSAYELRIIHKYGVTQLLDDLKIMAILRCTKNEIQILQERLIVYELVRVAVCEITEGVAPLIYVTVDLKMFEESSNFRPMPRLGRITEDDIPSYVFEIPDIDKFSSYSDCLISKPQFHNPHFYNGLIERCGIDPKTVCSYFPDYNRKLCIDSQTGQALLKESKLKDAKILANKALNCLEKKQHVDGLKFVDDAFKICPDDVPLTIKLYDTRSKLISLQMKSRYNLKSLCDLEVAFKLASKYDQISQQFIHGIFKAANSYYRLKQYKRAVIGFEFVLKCDKTHSLAARALNKIKTKHADKLLNLEEMSRIDLQEKKKQLLTELKKMKSL